MAVLVFCIILLSLFTFTKGFEEKVLENFGDIPLDEWFLEVNSELLLLSYYSAKYAWTLTINPSSGIEQEASEFSKIWTKWHNKRCTESEKFKNLTEWQRRMRFILCRGPKYTVEEGIQLSATLSQAINIYTETKICLPKSFDICLNYNRIWNYTYLKAPNRNIYGLDLSLVQPNEYFDYNPLHYFDGIMSHEYYVLRGVKNGILHDERITDTKIRQSPLLCFNIEPDLEKLMKGNFTILQRLDCALPADIIFRWAWEAWRLAIGPPIRKLYSTAIQLMNRGSKRNGYNNIGEAWREELEIENVEGIIEILWGEIKPYYKNLHAVLRNALWSKYRGSNLIDLKGTLPAHILGNMWSQDWSSYLPLLVPKVEIDIEKNLHNTNWSSIDMVKRTDDFFMSLGLNPMPQKFWNNSIFNKISNETKCHGTAANMFVDNDFRMIVCAERTFNDWYVITHEMGHLQYYMHTKDQPPIFQESTNSAFGEAIGDAIFLAMMTPQHLNRLELLPDKFLFTETLEKFQENEIRIMHGFQQNKEFLSSFRDEEIFKQNISINLLEKEMLENEIFKDIPDNPITMAGIPYPKISEINEKMRKFMKFKQQNDHSMNSFDLTWILRMALSKIPQIPFEYILDTFRWNLFSGKIPYDESNKYFWRLSLNEQGIHPPDCKNRYFLFDPAAKFHIADNTPYIRYFLASILQTQIFKGLCEFTIFGRFNSGEKLPMPLHRCDIYGSKRAGKLLKKALKLGASVHWKEVLLILTGTDEIKTEPLIEYYKPVFNWLEKLIIEYNIPVGW